MHTPPLFNRLTTVACILTSALLPFALHAQVVINEFVADNATVHQDEDGDFSDWIELKNDSLSSINLSGWYLTDDASNLTKWEFPSTTIAANGYLVIFASNKDRAISGSELHTNFGLSKNGEYLALVNPDGSTIESEFAPNFPDQIEDISYGLAGGTTKVTLIGEEAPCRAHVPSSDVLGNSWHLVGFNDRSWDDGTTGVGYDTATTYDSLINIDLEADMHDLNPTAYIRVPFTVTNISDIVSLQLRMKYDDGFVAFLNGVQVAAENPPTSSLTYNASASAQQLDGPAQLFETTDILAYKDELVVGDNMLAIHALNRNSSSSDMLIVPELTYTYIDPESAGTIGFLDSPTPGAENSSERIAESAPVIFSTLGGVYSTSFSATLTSSSPTIYYTLDGTEPSTTSNQYTGPISISSTTHLRARSFEAGFALGEIASETYTFIDSDLDSFSSNLPIIVIDNHSVTEISTTESEPAHFAFFEPGADGRTTLQNDFTFGTRAGIRRRGETSLRDTNNKPNLAVETWASGIDDDSNIQPFGMPAESDWVLWAPHSRDLSGLRNAFIYNLSNQTGNYAMRTRFVEVFLNVSGGDVSMADYAGLYVFMEKIKRDDNRVDVETLSTIDNTSPNIEGGYILKIDKSDPGQNRLYGMVQEPMYCVYPSPTDITTQQETYITNYIIDFEAQLSNPDPITGYPSFIDVDSFIDHNIFNLMTKNADGLRYSTYMHKSRTGKLTMGPIWDFDRSVESNGDSRDDDPLDWNAGTSDYINYSEARHWWGLLFENADFWQGYADRWLELRQDIFSDTNIAKTIDDMAEEVAEARERDIARWGFSLRSGSNGLDGTQQGEVNYMKWWLATRMAWIDAQMIPLPLFSQSSTPIADAFQLTITAPSSDDIYYTLDGSDPRAAGGALSASATLYTGAITVEPDTIVRARAWTGVAWGGNAPEDPQVWSGLTTGTYYREDLLLTEVHFNPRDPDAQSIYTSDAFEFIELQNTSSTTLDLTNYALDGGIEFSFASSAVTSLAPGDFVVIVKTPRAFASRYTTSGMNIAGAYTGKLSNGGENIRLEFNGEHVYDIEYNDARGWPAAADGGGHSLIPSTNALSLQGFDILDDSGNWRASAYIDGSPGAMDPELATSIVVNEVIAHTDTGNPIPFDSNDAIELYNPTATSITLDGSWYLSDDVTNPEKWNIPSGTVIPAGAWVSFDENDFHPNRDSVGFGLNKAGEQAVLSHRPGSGLDRIVDCIQFKGQANPASWGRYPDGDTYFQTLIPTVGSANQLAPDGIQITELMYNPPSVSGINADEQLEYIQLTNRSASSIALEDLVENSGTWRLDGGVSYTFANAVTMAPGEAMWIVPFDPILFPNSKTFFCAYYGLNAATARLVGPYSGDLSDSAERITLERPQASDTIEVEDISWIIVDEATWMDEYPWPSNADGTGYALLRIGAAGNDPASWTTDTDEYYNDSITYEKVSPGTATWNTFTSISNLSDSDYADVNSANGVTVSVVAGDLGTGSGDVNKLLDGSGQNRSSNSASSVLFTSDTTTARILVDLQSVQSVYQLNTYSWHLSTQQNQVYDLYYSTESSAPISTTAGATDSVELVVNGWIPLGSADSDYDTNTAGQVGVSWSLASAPLDARYFLFDIKDPQAFWGEIDILTADHFVINAVPKAWLADNDLPATDAAALLDSDHDGQLNWEEYHAGTHPLDVNSVFKITDAQISGMQLLVTWNAVTGKTYTIQYKADLADSNWTAIQSGVSDLIPESTVRVPINGSKGFIQISVDAQ